MDRERVIGIVGGGMGGLCLARLLQKYGQDRDRVIVYERDSGVNERDQGLVLGLNAEGMAVLSHVLSQEELESLRLPYCSDGFILATCGLRELVRFPIGMAVSRGKLRDYLLKDVPVQWGSKIVEYEAVADEERDASGALLPPRVRVVFEDGSKGESLDLLVAADGARSRIRAQRCPELEYEPLAIDSLYGVAQIPEENEPILALLKRGMTRLFGENGSTLLMMLFQDETHNELVWSLTWPSDKDPIPEEKDGEKLMEWLLNHIKVSGYGENIVGILATTTKDSFDSYKELHCIAPPKDPVRAANPLAPTDNVTLLGDAAHAMTTHRGLGANTTFEDALDLARVLCPHSLPGSPALKSLVDYEQTMFKRGFKNAIDSKQQSLMLIQATRSFWTYSFLYCLGGFFNILRVFGVMK